jgi:hypothetical protein
MKSISKTTFVAVAFGALTLASAAVVHAQETVTTTTAANAAGTTVSQSATTSEGTIQEFTPGSSRIIVKSASGPATYTYSKKTTFVDAAGNVVNYETIKAGEPTTVYYTMEAGQPVVTKVVVNRTVAAPVTKTETSETTTTTTTKH